MNPAEWTYPAPLSPLFFQAVCNLVSCPDSQLAAVEAGAVPCLRQLAKLGVPEIEVSDNNNTINK